VKPIKPIRDSQLDTLRGLIARTREHESVSVMDKQAREQVQELIANGVMLLKQLGGVATR
jgi:hypothetical protein